MSSHPAVDVPSSESPLTPMMKQYMEIKGKNPNTLLLYRMGDFYEMFFDDAKIAASVLGLTLTSRNHGGCDKTPLAGFPYHALDRYAHKLVKAGYKIAICEQMEDPKCAKGVVRRDVIEVITAGTAVEEVYIEEKSNNFIVSVSGGETLGLAFCDVSTGEFLVSEIDRRSLPEELARINPSEAVVPADGMEAIVETVRAAFPSVLVSAYDAWKFDYTHAYDTLSHHLGIASLQGLGLELFGPGISAAGALLSYLKEQKKNNLQHIATIKPCSMSAFALLDPASIRNLELLRPMIEGDTGGTLLSVLDKTTTAMGGRTLKRWITHPLKDKPRIEARLDCVQWLKKDLFARSELQLVLKSVADIERLIGRITFERANGRDCIALKQSLKAFPSIVKCLAQNPHPLIQDIADSLKGFDDLVQLIEKTIMDAPPLSVRDGGLIKPGISGELDAIREAALHGKQWIAQLQQEERRRTGIATLKVSYNKVFGYYIEVTNANSAQVPQDYIRKQTLSNAERFVTPQLKEMEDKILGAEERLVVLEHEIFVDVRRKIAAHCPVIQKAAEALAVLDIFIAFGGIAADRRYCRPELSEGADMFISEGRHPVVESVNPKEQFIPNDTELSAETAQIMLITGPNMAGKSTYLRQNALIALMAQMGSFVPAAKAVIGIVDKFFTRVGASDRLARGQSTFMIEMIEVANILNNATDRSLVLLDEVGRGTSTFDGISIAWAVAEYLHESPSCRPRTLFATHYHELTELELILPRIKNYHIKVKEWNDTIVFLRKIDKGSCDHSYGIQVARLAGVPKQVILRAKEILTNLENMELTPEHTPVLARIHKKAEKAERKRETVDAVQLNFLDGETIEIVQQLLSLDVDRLTPLEALNVLAQLRRKALSRDGD